MGQRSRFPLAGTYGREWAISVCTFVTTTSGTIGTQTGSKDGGVTVAKVGSEAGRYRYTFDEKTADIIPLGGGVIGAADAAFNVANGINVGWRNKTVASKYIDMQLTRSDTSADAEVEDGFSVTAAFLVKLA